MTDDEKLEALLLELFKGDEATVKRFYRTWATASPSKREYILKHPDKFEDWLTSHNFGQFIKALPFGSIITLFAKFFR